MCQPLTLALTLGDLMAYNNDANIHHTSEALDDDSFPTSGEQFLADLSGTRVGSIPQGTGVSGQVLTLGDFTPGYSGNIRFVTAAGAL